MTELEKRAEEYSIREIPFIECISQLDLERLVKQAYIAGATEETKLLSEHIRELQNDKGKLIDENKEMKILIASLVYEINQIWDINEMNEDLRKCAEKIEREVTLSKMTDDNRLVISALGFAVVPPKPKVDIKEV